MPDCSALEAISIIACIGRDFQAMRSEFRIKKLDKPQIPQYSHARDYGELAVTWADDRWKPPCGSGFSRQPLWCEQRLSFYVRSGVRFMVKSALGGRRRVLKGDRQSGYDYVKLIVTVAKKNGWDLEELDLIPKDIPAGNPISFTRKEVTEHNRVVKKILQRFSRLLTPPVPPDLERSILSKEQSSWLPWEQDVMEKAGTWRQEMTRARPEILEELGRAAKIVFTARDCRLEA